MIQSAAVDDALVVSSLVNSQRVAYVGSVHFASGEHVGLELEEPVGNCNGTVEGTAYFSCDERVRIP